MDIEDFIIGSLMMIYFIIVFGLILLGFKAIDQQIKQKEIIHKEQYALVEYVF